MVGRLKKVLALSMALMIFISSHSFAYFEHLCTITFKKTLSLNIENCLSDYLNDEDLSFLTDEPGDIPSFNKSICCEVELNSHNPGNLFFQNIDFNSPLFNAVIPPIAFDFIPVSIIDESLSHPLYSDSSPPRVQPIYILNQIFII